MSDRKICPMRFGAHPPRTPGERECLEERCAWWNDNNNECSVPVLANALEMVSTDIEYIEKRLKERGP